MTLFSVASVKCASGGMQNFSLLTILCHSTMKIDALDSLGCLSDLVLWSRRAISCTRAYVQFTCCRLWSPIGYVKENNKGHRVLWSNIFCLCGAYTTNIPSIFYLFDLKKCKSKDHVIQRGKPGLKLWGQCARRRNGAEGEQTLEVELSFQPTMGGGLSWRGAAATVGGTPPRKMDKPIFPTLKQLVIAFHGPGVDKATCTQ